MRARLATTLPALLVLFAAPPHLLLAQDMPTPPPTVTYDEATECAFVGMGFGLRLLGTKEKPATKPDEERGGALIKMANRFMQYAETSSGKNTEAVVAAMGQAGGTVMDMVMAGPDRRAVMERYIATCETLAKGLP